LADIVLQGFLVGGLYALIALGFVLIFKSSQVLNLAYGEMIAILSYFLYFLLDSLGFPLGAAILLMFVAGAGLGFLMERAFIRPLVGQPFLAMLMMTLMLMFLFKGIMALVWAGESYSFRFTPEGMYQFWGVSILPAAVWAFAAAISVFLLLAFLFRYTKIGLAMRVVAADHAVSQSLGIKVKQMFSLSWVISGAFAAACGILLGLVTMVTPAMGDIGLGKGLVVVLLGGMTSIPGALVGGLLLGLAEALGGYYWTDLREIIPWILMLLILIVRPWGMFGERRIERI
jgi:branched-chain amino acid transport system permease protein